MKEILEQGTARLFVLAPEPRSLMQSVVIRTASGKLIVLDGGIDGEGLDAKAYMPAALRAIAGVEDTGSVEVEAWILSHAHRDHFHELTKTLTECADDKNFVVKNIYFDFPEYKSAEYPYTSPGDEPYLEQFQLAIDRYAEARDIPVAEGSTFYNDLNGAYANVASIAAGCELLIDGVRLEFLQTWNAADGKNTNDTALVLRAWVGGQSILFLQDAATAAGIRLIERYGDALKSDIVQMAHHGQAGVCKPVYDMVQAKVRIWTTPIWVWNDTSRYEIGENRKWVHGGEDFTTASEYDIVTCLYDAYPSDSTKVSAWKEVINSMSFSLPYASVDTAPRF